MSKPRYRWWGYVRAVIRAYPELSRRLAELRHSPVTARYGPSGGAGGPTSPVERAAIRGLPHPEQREHDAVEAAIEQTKTLPDAAARLRLVDLVFWRQSHTLQGAAREVHLSYASAKRRQERFILLVAQNLGLAEKLSHQSQKTDVN